MPNKYQVGTVGGIRKVINVKAATSTATTIEGLENTSITLAQLKTLLGNTTTVQPTNPGTPSAGTQSLTVSNGTTSVANVTVIDVPSGINVSAPGGNTAVLAIPLPLTVTDGTHNETGVSTLLFQNAVNVTSTTAGQATVIMLPALKVTDGSTLATSIGEIIFTGAAVSTTSTNTSAVKVTITAGSLTVTDGSTIATSISELIFSGASVSTTSTNTTAAKITITGGGSLTVTDGSTIATSISELIFIGASVSTTSTNTTGAKVIISGGSSPQPFGIFTTPPQTGWTKQNFNTYTQTFDAQGTMLLNASSGGGNGFLSRDITAGSAFDLRMCATIEGASSLAFFVRDPTSGNCLFIIGQATANQNPAYCIEASGSGGAHAFSGGTYVATVFGPISFPAPYATSQSYPPGPLWYRVTYDGAGNWAVYLSLSGEFWTTLASFSNSYVASPAEVGIGFSNPGNYRILSWSGA